jgi:hypothetical protein
MHEASDYLLWVNRLSMTMRQMAIAVTGMPKNAVADGDSMVSIANPPIEDPAIEKIPVIVSCSP